jgi:hypothetical protein
MGLLTFPSNYDYVWVVVGWVVLYAVNRLANGLLARKSPASGLMNDRQALL